MYATPSQLTEIQKTQIDALNSFGQTIFNATEKLITLNLAATRALLTESAEAVQSLLGAKDIQQLIATSSSLSQPAVEKAVSYSRNVYGIASAASAEVTKLVETQVADGNRKLAEIVDLAAKNAPTGSEPVVSLFKSAAAAANNAFDTFSKAAKQASDWADTNFAAAANATVTAAAAANDAVRVKTPKVA